MIKYFDLLVISFVNIIFSLIVLFTQTEYGKYDKPIIYLSLLILVIFLFSVFFKKRNLIDLFHIVYTIYMTFVPFLISNILLTFQHLLITIIMLTYWFIFDRCPMGRYESLSFINAIVIKYNYFFYFLPIIIFFALFHNMYHMYYLRKKQFVNID